MALKIDAASLAGAAAQSQFTGVVATYQGTLRTFALGLGMADRAHAVANTAATRFAIASGAKAFTALTAMRLVEDGVLALDAPIRKHLGKDLPLVDDAVTLEHLLGHTSGIGDYLDESAGGAISDYVLSVPVHTLETTEAFVPVLDGHAQVSAPGTTFAYNNSGYVIAALVAERASGVPFHDLVQREVLDRARLTRTGYLRLDSLPGDAAIGYLDADGLRTNVLHLPVRGNGDGGIFTSADDLAKFWVALTRGSIVSHETFAAMTAPRHFVDSEGLRYGLGFWLHAKGPAVIIEGYDAGVSFRSTHNPETGVTATVLGNSSEGAWPVVGLLAPAFD